jgi:hypothetical protein
MILLKKVISTLLLLLAFAGLVAFISTSFEMNTTLAGEVKMMTIGFGSPWYRQVSRPPDFSRELNLLAPSFLVGVAGLLIILGHLVVHWRKN